MPLPLFRQRHRLSTLLLVAALGVGSLLSGCNPTPPAAPTAATGTPPATGGFPVTLTDSIGRTVTLPAAPKRIVSLSPAHTETLYALGLGEQLLAVDTYSDYPPEAKGKPRINCWPRPPLERLVALKPDLIVLFTEDADTVRRMQNAGMPVLKYFPTSFDGTLQTISDLGRATGTAAKAEALVAEMKERREKVMKAVEGAPRPKVMLELDAMDAARPYVAGKGGLYGEVLTLAGGNNLFSDQDAPAAAVTSEAILTRNPEVILLGDTQSPSHAQTPELVRKRAGWGTVKAVQTGKIHVIDGTLLTRPAPRLADGLEQVAKLLHPDRFK